MSAPEVEEFAQLLMKHVRDRAIQESDLLINPRCNSLTAKRLRERLKTATPIEFAAEIIPECVDRALFFLLFAIEDGPLRLSFTTESGKTVDLAEAGESEMAGWFAGLDWIKSYSNERFVDDFADLEIDFDSLD